MDFGAQVKALRETTGLTQEQFGQRLGVTRQAVSNWENNRNLPDIEMVLAISDTFGVPLEELVRGGKDTNNMTEKLVRDGRESRRAHMNLVSTIVGAGLMLVGLLLFWVKAESVEYVDSAGVLHENFFLIPLGYLFILCGVIVIASVGIRALVLRHKQGN